MTESNKDETTGRFLTSNNAGRGRPKGSRNRLGEAFIEDLYSEWRNSGASALKRMAADEPAQFVKVVAQILPREIDATLNIDVELFSEAKTYAQAFRLAQRFIGGELEDDAVELIEAPDDAA
jgi:hypothetical protein